MAGGARFATRTQAPCGVFTGCAAVLGGLGLGVAGLAAGVGLDTGEDLGVALGLGAAGVGAAGLVVGEALGVDVGKALATGDWTFTLDKPMNCHCPLRREKVSSERYCPLTSIDLPSVDLTTAFFTS